jgi:broad specificity phosphatase PhoE
VAVRVLLIRHGETDWTADRRHTGRTDLPLNPEGERRAQQLAPFLSSFPDTAAATVLTSPLQRARQTCALAGFGDRAVVDDDLVEWDYGEFEGSRTADLRTVDPAWSIWTAEVRSGESLDDVARRADRVIRGVGAIDGTVLLFAHAHLLRILAARWCGFPPVGGSRLTLLPASISVLGYEREVAVIEQWNLNTDSPPGIADHGYAGMGNGEGNPHP